MKRTDVARSAIVLAFLLAGTQGFAQFTGFFRGYYAAPHWTTALAGNPLYQDTATAERHGTPDNLLITGAVDAQQQIGAPQPPASVIDFTIALDGTGLQPVSFAYVFTGAADGYDRAQLIYDSGSGFQVIADLSTAIGVVGTYSGQLTGGRAFGFRVYSNNDNVPDTLLISAIPEPSLLTFLGLGIAALLLRLRQANGSAR
jgi:hypothetical protein